MKKDRILIDTAFDGDTAQIDALMQSLDERGRKELMALSEIKQALKGLGPRAECQLTTEHLKRAVLDRGGKQPSKISWPLWTGIAVPVAATLAIISVLPKGGAPTNADPIAIVKDDASESRGPVATHFESNDAPVTLEPTEAKPERQLRTSVSEPVRTRRPQRTKNVQVGAEREAVAESKLVHEGPVRMATAQEPVADTTVERTAEAQPVVVMGTDPDPETGTPAASEEHVTSDVVFGG